MAHHIGLTRGLPLLFIHFAVPLAINDMHPRHERSKFRMVAELRKHVMELFAVFEHQLVLGR